MEMLCFRLPGHGDTTLNHMNSLRSHQHFCDVTIVASDNQTFRGHKVVLAACSPFLRDQFLLNPSSKLQVSMLHSSTVVCDLLQSCYTGVLQFNPEEIVNYLTAASYLQMEHIVERCRGALKKYMQPRTSNPPRVKPEESQSRPAIVSGSAPAPPVGHPHSVQPHSPVVCSQDAEDNADKCTSPLLDDTTIKVNGSDEEEQSRQEDYDVYTVYLPEEEQRADNRRDPGEDRGGPSDGPQGACYSDTDGVLVGGGECGLNPSEHDINNGGLSRGGFAMEGLRAFRRRLSEPKVGRGRGRGRGFKRRKWVASQERRPQGVAHQDLWYLATSGIGGGFGLDYSQEGLKTGNYLSVDLPQMDFSMGEAQGEEVTPIATNGMGQYPLDESSNAGEGSSGLGGVPTDEGGDESVPVVGSTSSVSGPVICEHCGMTFPSVSSLAIHSRSTHMLYSCPCCGKHFHHSANLTRHMAVHRGAGKSHQCPLCYKTFTQKSTLIDHMNLHSGERPHHCAYCHARFAHKPALRRHLKEQHGKTTGQNSLHEQEEREREQVAGAAGRGVREEEQECLVTVQTS